MVPRLRRVSIKSDNEMHRFVRRAVASACLALLVAPFAVVRAQGGATPAPIMRARTTVEPSPEAASKNLGDLERLVVEGINAERKASGLDPLEDRSDLNEAAREYSRRMAEARFFGHVDLEGRTVSDRVESAGVVDWKNVGENIARNRGFGDPAQAAVREWMKSEPHRLNILNDRFRETGVGIWIGPDRTFYFTQIFVRRKK
jgi:uncharacterized protein YkwD